MPSSITTFHSDLEKLIRKFEADRQYYSSKNYLEAQARMDLITPFFKALGWDVENEAGLLHHEREVLVERGDMEATGRPDYNFRVGGQTKFYVEAKAHQRAELMGLVGLGEELVSLAERPTISKGSVPLAKYVREPFNIRARFKRKTFRARVRRDGRIRFRGKIYKSPSAAGSAVCKRACNGWWFWKYERAPGDWVRLNVLKG